MNLIDYNIDRILFIVFMSFRIGAFFLSMPFFSEVKMPLLLKFLVPVALAALLGPAAAQDVMPELKSSIVVFIFGLIHEVMIGLIMGFAVKILFTLANIAGELTGISIGFSMATLFDPSLGHVSQLSMFTNIFLVLAFFTFNVHHTLIMALMQSYFSLPIGGSFFPIQQIAPALFHLFSAIYLLAFRFALPVIATILMGQVIMSVIAITAPEMNIYFNAAVNLNVMIGMMILALSFGLLFQFFQTGIFSLNDFYRGYFILQR